MNDQVLSRLHDTRIVAVIRGVDARVIPDVVQAFYDGGIRVVEVTLNTNGAVEAIEALVNQFGDSMSVGAGTVLTNRQAKTAFEHGAQFFVTPHVGVDVIEFGLDEDVPVIVGAMTPTEIYNAYTAGASLIKVFPITTLGTQYLTEVRGPFNDIPLVAVGGVTPENAIGFLRSGSTALGIGGGLVDKIAIKNRDFDALVRKARLFVEIVQGNLGA